MKQSEFLDTIWAHRRVGYGRMMQLADAPTTAVGGEVSFERVLTPALAAWGAPRVRQIISRAWWLEDKIGAIHESGDCCYGSLTEESRAECAALIKRDPLFATFA